MRDLFFNEDISNLQQKLQRKYHQLNDDDFSNANDRPDQLLSRLQWKLGMSKREIIEMIERL